MKLDEYNESELTSQISEQTEAPESIEILEASEIQEGKTFEYSQAHLDERGEYHAANVTGIYASPSDSRATELAEDLNSWEQQRMPKSCVVQCERMAIEHLAGLDVTESELRALSNQNRWYSDSIGTFSYNVGKIAECYGLEREQIVDMTIDELVQKEGEGMSDIIIGVDQMLLHYPMTPKISTNNHGVKLIGFDFSDKDNPMVILNDPGQQHGRGVAYPLKIFENAACKTDPFTGKKTLHLVTVIYNKEAKK